MSPIGFRISPTLGYLGLAISAAGAVLQYKSSRSYQLPFHKGDWAKSPSGEYTLVVSRAKHRKGAHPTATVYERSLQVGFQKVMCDIDVNERGDITLRGTPPDEGKIVVVH